jgi:hypothetical protein
MEGHLRAWSINRALAWIYATAAVALVGYLYLSPHGLPPRIVSTGIVALPALTLFHALAAHGARLRQPWARIASLLMGVLLLVAFPIGTIVGAFLVWACAHPWPDARAHAGAPTGAWHQDGRRR